MEKKSVAASQFNTYVKKLSLTEKNFHEKYLGTIFTKQQTGFSPEHQQKLNALNKKITPKFNEDPSLSLKGCAYNDYDPYIKFGRDNQLFIKREYLDRLKEETKYTEDQIKNLKVLYTSYAEIGKGLNFPRFKKFLSAIFNIENHPFSEDFFLFFDSNRDGLIDFYEIVLGMDTIEKGSFDDKAKFCFAMYDLLEYGSLDIITLREVLKKSYVNQIVALEQAILTLKDGKTKYPEGWTWEEFESQILPSLEMSLPVAFDRMEFHKSLINELEFRYNFTLESLEHLWNMYRGTIDKGISENRLKTAVAYSAHSPELITKEQFKLIMFDIFKVKDAQLVNNVFVIADNNGNGALDIRELIGNIVFWLRGTLSYKFALFFEVFVSVNSGYFVSRENLIKVVGDALKVFKETFFLAKTTADKMNVQLNGMISYDEFRDYCKFNPSSIDFLCRLTIGPYPLSPEIQQKLFEYQQAQLSQYYPQLMAPPQMLALENGQSPMKSGEKMTPQKQIMGQVPPPGQPYNPANYQIVPLEDKTKQKYGGPPGRFNFAGIGEQQIFKHIRSTTPVIANNNNPSLINPQKRWMIRD